MNKTTFTTILFFLFSLLLVFPLISATTYNASAPEGVYTGDSAIGTLVEREANGTGNGYSSVIFGSSGPLTNGTNQNGVSTSGFGISASSDIYVVTFGPELEDASPIAAEPLEEEQKAQESSLIPPSDAGGGGGGSSRRDTYGLTTGDILTIIINGETHTITINSVRENDATLTVESVPQKIELTVGETKELDITASYLGSDVAITLDSVSDLRKIILTVEDLTTRTSEEEIKEETLTEQEQTPELLQTITAAVSAIETLQIQETTKEIRQGITSATKWIILINIALGILISTGVGAKKLQQRKIYNIFHEITKEELITQDLKKVEFYVKQTMKQGYHYQEIKEQLLGVGWLEYEIDEVITNAMLAEKQELYSKT